jgi:hypothetical protein
MPRAESRIKPGAYLNYTGSNGWHGYKIKPAPNPETCHCGAKALYRMGDKGFCRSHHADAVAEAMKTRTRGEL